MRYLKLFFIILSFFISNFTFASESSGTIDSTYKSTKICKDASCSDYGNINWKPTGSTAVNIDDTAGLTGYIWGDEIGWVNLDPTGYGVSISTSTGALTGYAYAQGGGWINFNPTDVSGGEDVGVVINSNGEFDGWAWVSGAYGGWMKFDCASASTCVKTDWRPFSSRSVVEEEEPEAENSSGGGGGGSRPRDVTSTSTPAYDVVEEDEVLPSEEPTNVLDIIIDSNIRDCSGFDVCVYNEPLIIDGDKSGIVSYEFDRGVSAVIEVQKEVYEEYGNIKLEIRSYELKQYESEIRIVGDTLFDIRAFDEKGNEIHTFSSPFKIVLSVPDYLKDNPNLGVYWFDDKKSIWERVENATWSESSVTFFVDHLTKFAIMEATSAPKFIQADVSSDENSYSYMFLYAICIIIVLISIFILLINPKRK